MRPGVKNRILGTMVGLAAGLLIFLSNPRLSPAAESNGAQPAAPDNNTCLTCHRDNNESDNPQGPAHLWPTSIHSTNGIACANCHGGDPTAVDPMEAMNPDKGFVGTPKPEEIPDFCGKCHSAVRDNYKKSVHWTTDKEKKPVCTTCHTAHAQQSATLGLINETLCTQCHSFDRAKRIRFVMEGTEKRLDAINRNVDRLKVEGFDTRRTEEIWFANRNMFHRLTHEVSVDALIQETDLIGADLGKLEKSVQQDDAALESRRTFGVVMVVFFLVAALLFHLFRKTL